VKEYGLEVVQAYMRHIQNCAEQAVRDMLRSFSLQEGMEEQDSVFAQDFLDDGTPIALTVHIDRATGSAVFDFVSYLIISDIVHTPRHRYSLPRSDVFFLDM
jgi:5-oxoprolinase (ATP-hydrolysing)